MDQPSSRTDILGRWIPTIVGGSVGLVAVIVGRIIILSVDGVQRLAFRFLIRPSVAYPWGLSWYAIIDVLLMTVLLVVVLNVGRGLGKILWHVFPEIPALGDCGDQAGLVGAAIVGYFAYDALIVPPLRSQGAVWVYNLIFALILVWLLAVLAGYCARAILKARKEGVTLRSMPRDVPFAPRAGAAVPQCAICGAWLTLGGRYCNRCGAPVEDATSRET